MKITLTVEVDINPKDLISRHTPTKKEDWEELKNQLLGSWMKVKSGAYENSLMGTIEKVTY